MEIKQETELSVRYTANVVPGVSRMGDEFVVEFQSEGEISGTVLVPIERAIQMVHSEGIEVTVTVGGRYGVERFNYDPNSVTIASETGTMELILPSPDDLDNFVLAAHGRGVSVTIDVK